MTLSVPGVASAATTPTPYPNVVSAAGITALQIAPAGASDSQIDLAVRNYQKHQSATPRLASPNAVNGTADYVKYCEEGTSGLMVWTYQKASNCYGWYYEYQNGVRLSKVNMLKLKATASDYNPVFQQVLIDWCNANGFYCAVAFFVGDKLGAYLWGLLFL